MRPRRGVGGRLGLSLASFSIGIDRREGVQSEGGEPGQEHGFDGRRASVRHGHEQGWDWGPLEGKGGLTLSVCLIYTASLLPNVTLPNP